MPALNVPASQLTQEAGLAAPLVLLYVPALQPEQVVDAGALQEPSAQHTPAPTPLYLPAAHSPFWPVPWLVLQKWWAGHQEHRLACP